MRDELLDATEGHVATLRNNRPEQRNALSTELLEALAAGDRASRMTRLTDLPAEPLKGLAGAVLIYPYAGFPSMTTARGWGGAKPKVGAILGGKDVVVGVSYPPRA